jgi:hypothetical protein
MYFVASRSLLGICDHKISNPESSSKRIPSTFPTKKGQTVYCHVTALKSFISSYLPKIKFPFVLVSGDSYFTIPDDFVNETQIILNHPLLLCWYCQNCTNPSEKLIQLPLGLDLHTFLSKSTLQYFWNKTVKPIESIQTQEQKLFNISNTRINKKILCYGNFQFLTTTRHGNDRTDCINQVSKSLVYYEPTRIPRDQCWNQMSKYKYILSPHGNGLDCHRTWEALALGCIPIMKTSALDPMFEGLPVLIVNKWSDVTQELLDNFKPSGNLNKLRLSYWKDLFDKHK